MVTWLGVDLDALRVRVWVDLLVFKLAHSLRLSGSGGEGCYGACSVGSLRECCEPEYKISKGGKANAAQLNGGRP